MTTTNITNARKNLYSLVNEINQSHQPVHIIGKKSSAILISEADWESIKETLYLSSIPGMVESIKKGGEESFDQCSKELNW